MQTTPTFAIIGRVNKGKSSIVASLAEDDSINIRSEAGTTRECHTYPVRIDGRTLLTLVDTPGFQQAPRALAWLREHEVAADKRHQAVLRFLQTFRNTDEFPDECRLLEPIMDGAGILYVVDGAKPFRRNYEAEMEILRWTGQPRMALINRIGEGDHTAAWRPALDQYFSLVRDFDAQGVGFEDRVSLLQALRELHQPWRAGLDEAIEHLQEEWHRRERSAALTIASMLVDCLTYQKEISLGEHEDIGDYKSKLEGQFHDALRDREKKARRAIEKLYQHHRLETAISDLERPAFDRDLFAEETWDMLGLSLPQLVAVAAVAGAMAGGAIDVAVGGASFLLGTILGGAIGGGSVLYFSGKRLMTIEHLGNYLRGNEVVRVGPHKNQNFPWVLLDRALLHYFTVRNYSHSRRDVLTLEAVEDKVGLVSRLKSQDRSNIGKLFARLQRNPDSEKADVRDHLQKEILKIIRRYAD